MLAVLARPGVPATSGTGRAFSVAELAHALEVTRQAATQSAGALKERGYLAFRAHGKDRRKVELVLTDRGLAAAHALREFEQVLEAGLAQALSLAELAALWDGLAALAEVSRRSAARVIERRSGSGPGRVVERRSGPGGEEA